jgi:uridine kinase
VREASAPGPVRVAVDGVSTAGKTTLADELASRLGAATCRVSLDDFHRPGHKFRSMRDEWTASLYEREGYDWQAFRESALDASRIRAGVWDSYRDEPLPDVWTEVADDGFIVIDGMFLLSAAWAGFFDVRIWLDVSPETVLARACERDVAWVGSVTAVRERYEQFWLPAHARYLERERPWERADVIVRNDDWAQPSLAG